jgi:hypothetical protein
VVQVSYSCTIVIQGYEDKCVVQVCSSGGLVQRYMCAGLVQEIRNWKGVQEQYIVTGVVQVYKKNTRKQE